MLAKIIYVVEIILPIFLIIGLGQLTVRTRVVGRAIADPLSKLTFFLALPFVIFLSIARSRVLETANWGLILAANVTMILFAGCLYLIATLLKLPPARKGPFVQASYRGNMAYVGLPVCLFAFGEPNFPKATLFLAAVIPAINALAVLVLTLPRQHAISSRDLLRIVRSIVKNPLIIAAAAGLVFSIWEIHIPMVLQRTIEPVGKAALPLVLIALGASMRFEGLGKRLTTGLLPICMKLIVFPLGALLVFRALGFPVVDARIAVIMLGTPAAVAGFTMAREMGADAEYAGDLVMLTTLGSIVSLPAWLLYLL